MKKSRNWVCVIRLLAFVLTFCMFYLPINAEAATRSDAYKAYNKLLNKSSDQLKYALVSIDNDNIPELVIREDDLDYKYYRVYTFKDKSVVEIGNEGFISGISSGGSSMGYDFRFYPEKGKIIYREYNRGNGEENFYIYSIKDGNIKRSIKGQVEYEARNCYWNGKKVSYDTYERRSGSAVSKGTKFDDLNYVNKKKMQKKLK